MTLHDIYLLSPELSVAILAAVVITVDLMVRNKRILPIIAFVDYWFLSTSVFSFGTSDLSKHFLVLFKWTALACFLST